MPTSSPPFPYGEVLRPFYIMEKWTSLTITGRLQNQFDVRRVRERKWASPLLDLASYRRRRENFPTEYWSAVLTPRQLVLIEKAGFSFEIYKLHLCAHQFGVAQACVIPFGRTIWQDLSKRVATPIDDALETVSKLADLRAVRALPPSIQASATKSFLNSWLAIWSTLLEQVSYFSLCKEEIAYEVPSKAAPSSKRKASTSNFVSCPKPIHSCSFVKTKCVIFQSL